MRKDEVIQSIVKMTGVETADVNLIVSAMLKVIKKEVGKGNRVDFRGFGCFQPKVRKAKIGRDITRGTSIQIPTKVEPSFRHSKKYFTVTEQPCTT